MFHVALKKCLIHILIFFCLQLSEHLSDFNTSPAFESLSMEAEVTGLSILMLIWKRQVVFQIIAVALFWLFKHSKNLRGKSSLLINSH